MLMVILEKQFIYCLDNDMIISKIGVKSKLFSISLL